MRFHTLGGIFAHYHELRESLMSAKTNMPMPEALRQEVFVSNPEKARSGIEGKYAFIADVQNAVNRLEWYESEVIWGRFPPPGEKQTSWRKLAKSLRVDIRDCPKSFLRFNKISEGYRKRLIPQLEEYFRERGYLW